MLDNLPVVSIIGQPNVGKSTLINRLTQNKDAIVHSQPMITRDRKYYLAEWNCMEFYITDTGGIDLQSKERLSLQIFLQAKKAIDDSDLVIFMVDIKQSLSAKDIEIAEILRKTSKDILFVGNKYDSMTSTYYTEDYLSLGFGYPIMVSAAHGLNTGDLLDEIVERIKKNEIISSEVKDSDVANVAILGKPNVGKSTLFNTLISEERVIVDDVEGTTRDSIDSIIKINDKTYRFIDTAGIRRDKRREEELEYYSKIRTIRTIERSDVGLIIIDSLEKVTKQDINIVNICLEKGLSICIVFNKIDIADREKREELINSFNQKMYFADFVPFLKISALKKKGITKIFDYINFLMEERNKKISDNKLTNYFKSLEDESVLFADSKKFKIKFMRQLKTAPPIFLLFTNMDVSKKKNIKKFVEKKIREEFGFVGSPIILKFKH
jgi:GTPase